MRPPSNYAPFNNQSVPPLSRWQAALVLPELAKRLGDRDEQCSKFITSAIADLRSLGVGHDRRHGNEDFFCRRTSGLARCGIRRHDIALLRALSFRAQ